MKRGGRLLLTMFALILAFSMMCGAMAASNADGEVVIDVYADYQQPKAEESDEETVESGGVLTTIEDVNSAVNDFAWGPVMLALLVGTGVWFTVRTKGFQFRHFGHVWKNTIGKVFKKSEKKESRAGEVTPFQALTTAMAATVGTGNIAGVSGAIILGGPGAIFWMWVSALFGMMTKFAEVVLAIKYREKNEKGEWVGGPMYYIKNGLGKNWRWLAVIFSVFGSLAAFGIGNASQVGTIASTIVNAAENLTSNVISGTSTETAIRWTVGIILVIVVAAVIIGGVKRIGVVTEKLVPFMSAFYIVGALIVILSNISQIGPVLGSIFSSAFAPRAVVGGVSGFVILNTIKRGVGRGVFSNEAGLGSAPIAHAASSESDPVKQGMFGIFEVFMDTIVICTMTSLVLLMSGVVVPWGNENVGGAVVMSDAFGTVFGNKISSIFIAVAILCFAVSTILSWSLYGQRCFGFLTKNRGIMAYRVVFLLVIVVGATMNLGLAWDISDTLNGLMAIPNLIALLGLSGVVFKLTRDYLKNLKPEIKK